MNSKEEYDFIQIGNNTLFPKEVSSWKEGEELPTWLLDRGKILLTQDGEFTIKSNISKARTGLGREYISSDGKTLLTRTQNESDYVIFNKEFGIFSLTEKQFDFIYRKK